MASPTDTDHRRTARHDGRPTVGGRVARVDGAGPLDRIDGARHPDGEAGAGPGHAGTQPAGVVLVVMVAALLLAMLLNADDLTRRAEQRPLGPERDRSLTVWHPVQDVSHGFGLHLPRQLVDRLLDGDDTPGGDATRSAGPPGDASPARDRPTDPPAPTGKEAPAAEPELRSPTADHPLRLWVGGDSMAQVFGESLTAAATGTEVIDATLHYEISSGLTRPDYFDWPRALAADAEELEPEVMVVVFGANDAQGIVLPDGTPVPDVSDPRWAPEYRRRVAAVMDQLEDEGRLVVWVGQPPMRDPVFDSRIDLVDGVAEAEAAARPGVRFVDTDTIVGDADGTYADLVAGPDGDAIRVRQADGIHLTRAGGDLVAAAVMEVIAGEVDLSGAGDDRATSRPRTG